MSVKEKPQNSETRRDRIYGCWTTTGRRFTLFLQRDFGLDLIERAHIEIVDGRYIGVIREFEGGVERVADRRHLGRLQARRGPQLQAVRRGLHGDFCGVEDAVFFRSGGLAYSCNGNLRITDSKGDRELEPQGAKVTGLAVSANAPASARASTTPPTRR